MLKLLEFSNLQNLNYESVEGFMRRHNIYFTLDGQSRGYERAIFTKRSKNFFSLDETNLPLFLSSSVENEKKIGELLKLSQMEYRGFLDSCAAGRPDIDFLNDIISQFSAHDLRISQTNPFNFSFEIEFPPRNLEQHIEVYDIIYPLWRGEGESFSRVKKCKFCEKYFLAVSLKGEFCEKKCRNAYNYKRNK
jgi:hypothetical protein